MIHKKKILRRIDFHIDHNEILVIIGPSGTGKSTLLRTLAGLYEQNTQVSFSGTIQYLDQNLLYHSQKPILVAQKLEHQTLTVKETLLSNLPDRSSTLLSEQHQVLEHICQHYSNLWLIEYFNQPVFQLTRVQQKILFIIRAMLTKPALLMLDEPTAGLTDNEAKEIHDLIIQLKQTCSILIVSHHLSRTKKIADHVALLANGVIEEYATVNEFFHAPKNAITCQFLRTGSCAEMSEDALDALDQQGIHDAHVNTDTFHQTVLNTIDTAQAPSAAIFIEENQSAFSIDFLHHRMDAKSHYQGPRGFVWLIRGKLAGVPLPGIVAEVQQDLNDLKKVGVTDLISLTETVFHHALTEKLIIDVTHFPIIDMKSPTCDEAYQFCLAIDEKIFQQKVVAIHCKAGLGRTGTMLAVYYLWCAKGQSTARQAIDHIRSLNFLMIQSQEQIDFLHAFSMFLTTKCQLK